MVPRLGLMSRGGGGLQVCARHGARNREAHLHSSSGSPAGGSRGLGALGGVAAAGSQPGWCREATPLRAVSFHGPHHDAVAA